MPLLIVGQGLAGSLLGWACEQAGVAFRIIDAGHQTAASRIGAGLINPLTGRRLVPTWRIAEWRDEALACYRELEIVLGRPLVTEIRIRRRYRDEAERGRFEARLVDPAVARWIHGHDADGLWIAGGAQIDTAAVIAGLRERWRTCGWLREERAGGRRPESEGGQSGRGLPHSKTLTRPTGRQEEAAAFGVRQSSAALDPLADSRGEAAWADRLIWCTGAARVPAFAFVPWERAKGEIIGGALVGLEPNVLLNDGHWVLPGPVGQARVGATYNRIQLESTPSPEAREELVRAARRLTGRAIDVTAHDAAVRVTTPDRRPVIGWLPGEARCGIFSGLGSKGALWAPALARQWLQQLREGRGIDPEVDLVRYATR